MRVLSFIQSSLWAMREQEFSRMLHIAARRADSLDSILARAEAKDKDFSTVMSRAGEPLAGTRYVDLREGKVAVIDLNGTISKRMNLFAELCGGGTSTELLAQDFQACLDNPNVAGIVFNIDSPGGEAFGINEFANQVYQARGKKPIKAYVSGLGCSGAYWIASACDEVICDKSAFLGSIGVISVWMDDREFYKMLGIDKKVVTSSNAPKKWLDLNDEADMAEFQAELDAMEKVFIGAVARNRKKKMEEVISDFNQGGVLVGADAVKAGMADRTGSLEEVISELKKSSKKPNGAQNAQGETTMSLFQKFQAWLSSDEVKPLLENENKSLGGGETTDTNADSLAAYRARAERAEAENQRLLQEKLDAKKAEFEAKTKSYVESEKRAGRLTPGEEKEFSATYLQALIDDAVNPLAEGSRVAFIEAAQAKRIPHLFNKEVVAPDATAKVLHGEDLSDEEKMKAEVEKQVKNYVATVSPKGGK